MARAGAPAHRAKAAMILVHGRGASAESMLSLADVLAQPDFAYLAPQAARGTWYPQSFLAPLEDNQPWLSSALQTVADAVRSLEQEGFPAERVALLGFSQGGCLTLGICRAQCTAWRGRGPERGIDRARGHATRLCGFARRDADVSGMQRHRWAHSARTRG